MNILIIGGTRFIGRHIALHLFASGPTVTLMHRSESMALELPQFEHLIVDRRNFENFKILRTFDLAIDTCAYVPSDLAILNSISFHRYLFISSVAVYRSSIPDNSSETAPRISKKMRSVCVMNMGFKRGKQKILCCTKFLIRSFCDLLSFLAQRKTLGD